MPTTIDWRQVKKATMNGAMVLKLKLKLKLELELKSMISDWWIEEIHPFTRNRREPGLTRL